MGEQYIEVRGKSCIISSFYVLTYALFTSCNLADKRVWQIVSNQRLGYSCKANSPSVYIYTPVIRITFKTAAPQNVTDNT